MDMILDFGNLRGKKVPLHYFNLKDIHVPNKQGEAVILPSCGKYAKELIK